MIGKTTKGKSFGGTVKYVLGKKDAQLIYTNVFAALGAEVSTEAIAAEMTETARRNRTSQPVYHLSVSPAETDRLSIKDWVNFSQDLLQELGLEKNQVIVALHNDEDYPSGQPRPHAHFVINLVDDAGKLANTSWDYRKTELALRRLERCYELTPLQFSWECQPNQLEQVKPEQSESGNLTSTTLTETELCKRSPLETKSTISDQAFEKTLEREIQVEQNEQELVMAQAESDEQQEPSNNEHSYKRMSDILAAANQQDNQQYTDSSSMLRPGTVAGKELEQFGQFLQRYGDQEVDGMQLTGAGLSLLGNGVKIADAIAEALARAREQADQERINRIIDNLEAAGERTQKLEQYVDTNVSFEDQIQEPEAIPDFLPAPESIAKGQVNSVRINQVINNIEAVEERSRKLEVELSNDLEQRSSISESETVLDSNEERVVLLEQLAASASGFINPGYSHQSESLLIGGSKYQLVADPSGDLFTIYQSEVTDENFTGGLEADESTGHYTYIPPAGRLIAQFDYEKEQWVSPLDAEELKGIVSDIHTATQWLSPLSVEESEAIVSSETAAQVEYEPLETSSVIAIDAGEDRVDRLESLDPHLRSISDSETFPDLWAEVDSEVEQLDSATIVEQLQNAKDLKELQQIKEEYGKQATTAAWNTLSQSERDRLTELSQSQEQTATPPSESESREQLETAKAFSQTENPLVSATELLNQQINSLEEQIGDRSNSEFITIKIDREASFDEQLDQIEAAITQLNNRLDKLEEVVKTFQAQREMSNDVADTLVDHAKARAEVYGTNPEQPIPTRSMGTIEVLDQGNYVAIRNKDDELKFEAVKLSDQWEFTTNELSEEETKRLINLPRDSENYRTQINGRDLVKYLQHNAPDEFLGKQQGTIQWQDKNNEFSYKFTIDKTADGLQSVKGIDKNSQVEVFSATIQADGAIRTSKSEIPTEKVDSLLMRERDNNQQSRLQQQQKTVAKTQEQELSQ